jgi:hypothetical protein
MHFLPEVIQLGQIPLAVGVLTGLLGALLAYWLAGRLGKPLGVTGAAQDLVLNLAIGGFLGAKLVYILLDPMAYLKHPLNLLLFPYGPLALPAAILGGLAGAAWGLRRQQGALAVLDAAVPALILGLAAASLGWKGPGHQAFFPLLLLAGAGALILVRISLRPGQRAAAAAVMAACALVIADLFRPGIWPSGISPLQWATATAGTLAFLGYRLLER